MYYLKLSGFIPENKQKEFEQTYRLVSSQMPKTCRQHSIARDMIQRNVYHFVSYWASSPAMESFSRSSAFTILIGAFKTLGDVYDYALGEMMQTKDRNLEFEL